MTSLSFTAPPAFGEIDMGVEVFAHHVSIESIDYGTAVARLDPSAVSDAVVAPEAVLALAHHSCGAAISGITNALTGKLRCTPVTSNVTHLRSAHGVVSAAALVDRELPHDVADDIRRNGNARARVNVAVVDDEGEPVAHGMFEFLIANA